MSSSRDRSDRTRIRDAADASEHVWTFLSNFAHVLVCIAQDPDLTLREIAERVGITERATHRLVAELESAGVITRERTGRRNHYEIDLTAPMRHPLEADKTVGDLLSALLGKKEAASLRRRSRAS